jgi:hypothetical protein
VYVVARSGGVVGRAGAPRPWDSPAGRKLLTDLLQ